MDNEYGKRTSACSLNLSENCRVSLPSDNNSNNSDSDNGNQREHRTNYIQTLMHLLNGFVGSGILSMPYAFKDGGIVLATVLNPLIGILSCYCIHLLLSANQFVMQTTNRPPLEYHEVAEFAFRLGPTRLRGWAKTARLTVVCALVATQLGGCCVYFLFISTNFHKFLVNMVGASQAPSTEQILAMIIPLMIAVNWIRNIRHLSFFSTISNILQLAGILIIFYNLLSEPLPAVSRLPAVGEKIPQYFVSTLFIYEGISVSMSLFKVIDKPRNFSKPFGVLNVGLSIIIFCYCSLGFLGYVRYGQSVKSSITLSLPSTPLYDSVQMMYSVAVLFTYPLILYVPIQVLWPMIEKRFFSSQSTELGFEQKLDNTSQLKPQKPTADNKKSWQHRAKLLASNLSFRAGLVLFTYILAAAIPRLDLIISLVGAITSSSIAITIPAILNTVIFWDQSKGFCSKFYLLAINGTITTIGLFAFVFGAYSSIEDIINSYQNIHIEARNVTLLPMHQDGVIF